MDNRFNIFALFIILPSWTYSQPVIDNSWFYSLGDTSKVVYYYPTSSMEPETGLDFIWDISNATTPNGFWNFIWEDPINFECFNEFPGSTLGYKLSQNFEYYFNVNNGIFQQTGYRSSSYKRIYLGGYPVLSSENFSYGDTIITSYSYKGINSQNMDTVYHDVTDILTYCGFGSVITPDGTYDNCVMTMLVRSSSNSFDEIVEYNFHKDNLANTIASYKINPPNVEPSFRITYKNEEISLDTNNPEKWNIVIKHSRGNYISVETHAHFNGEVLIYDSSGRLLFNQPRDFFTGTNEIELARTNLAGIYFLLIKNTELNLSKSSILFR